MKLVALAAAWIARLLIGLELNVHVPALVLFTLASLILAWLFRSKDVSPWPALLAVVVLVAVLRVEVSGGPALCGRSGLRRNLGPRSRCVSQLGHIS